MGGIFWDEAIKITRDNKWNGTKVGDTLLIGVICQEAGLPQILGKETDSALAVEKLEKTEGIAARQIVEFVLRGLDYGWLDLKEPYGYRKE